MTVFVGSDIGGTFTDVVSYDADKDELRFGKRLTTTADLVDAVFQGLGDVEVAVSKVDILKHGSTQVINTFLERRGARIALVTTIGFRDVVEIGRAGRPVVFRLDYKRLPALVDRNLRFEVGGRIASDGTELAPLDLAGLAKVADELETGNVEAVAISFINSYRNAVHEEQAVRFLRERLPGVFVTAGTELSRQWFEYERTSTAVANAYVGPRSSNYVERFKSRLSEYQFKGQFQIMASHGGVLSPRRAKEQPVALVESGPIGGIIGATAYARALGRDRVIAFDMGGTTAKCALVEDGSFGVQETYFVGGYEYGFPIRTPVLDIVEVGTGGGSIAHLDSSNALHVGPRSAGSTPGPACFLRGGVDATVTDANLVLGRISGDRFLGGELSLDLEAASRSILENIALPLGFGAEALDSVAGGVIELANGQMADAIKEITVERGRDARDFDLFVFGGGGPLHGVSLARALGIRRVIVPPEPGNFSALGMLLADARLNDARSILMPLDGSAAAQIAVEAQAILEGIAVTLRRDFRASEIAFETSIQMRYSGQRSSIELSISGGETESDLRSRFLAAYRRRFGHADENTPLEIVAVKGSGSALTPKPDLSRLHRAGTTADASEATRDSYLLELRHRAPTKVLNRFALPVGFVIAGPAVIEEFGSTCVIGPFDRLEVGKLGELCIELNVAS